VKRLPIERLLLAFETLDVGNIFERSRGCRSTHPPGLAQRCNGTGSGAALVLPEGRRVLRSGAELFDHAVDHWPRRRGVAVVDVLPDPACLAVGEDVTVPPEQRAVLVGKRCLHRQVPKDHVHSSAESSPACAAPASVPCCSPVSYHPPVQLHEHRMPRLVPC